jgi:ribosome-associated protein
MTDTTSGKKDTLKLQIAIVDALEDVKAQDLQVFDTEHLSALFERVIIASGSSNRQTKALAASVRDKVREAGFPKPRIEGEENGEWIIVDCGAAVVHVMQPTIRQYYNLEELWGEKPVRLKLGAPKPLAPAEAAAAKKVAAKKTRAASTDTAAQAPVKAPARRAAKTAAPAAAKAPAKRAAAKTTRQPAPVPSETATSDKKPAKPSVKRSTAATKTEVTKVVVPAGSKRAPAKKAAAKTAAAPAKAAPRKRAPAKKVAPGQA